ncbi:MAG: hypothetical protein QOD76_2074 [Solirubrobacteraceae bacterium]|nr:hypothetical protein [Solirubrobacteraceae bacterium]
MRRARSWIAAATAALVLGAAGCGFGPGSGTEGVKLTVTRDFGGHQVGSVSARRTAGSETVMRFLERNFKVRTRYGGGFVQAINGLSGGRPGGRPTDWFYYVNGIEAPQGAAATVVHHGDRVWWDRHDWGAANRVPAVVGSFPEPFLSGVGGKRLPVRLDCAGSAGAACQVVEERLRAVGVPAARAAPGAPPGGKSLRVLVGAWSVLRGDPVARELDSGPARSGVYARFDGGGTRLVALDARGAPATAFARNAGLVAATRYADQQPTWLVTGVDQGGVLAAARALDEPSLRNRFALVVVPGNLVGVPVAR